MLTGNRLFADLDQHDHRPYPAPTGPWAMKMVWHDLLFMHWPVPAAMLRPLLPPGLVLDTYTGHGFVEQAFLAVAPFRMSGVRARFAPPVPTTSAFPELNVRTYVRAAAPPERAAQEPLGRPGVYFFSLEAASRLAVAAARATFNLPYMRACISCPSSQTSPEDLWIEYHSRRVHRGQPPAEFRARYRPTGPVIRSSPHSLERFLTERYCLYTVAHRDRGSPGHRLLRAEIHHGPWPLQPAEAQVEVNTMADPLRIDLAAAAHRANPARGDWPLLHFARRLEVVAWPPHFVAEPVPLGEPSVLAEATT